MENTCLWRSGRSLFQERFKLITMSVNSLNDCAHFSLSEGDKGAAAGTFTWLRSSPFTLHHPLRTQKKKKSQFSPPSHLYCDVLCAWPLSSKVLTNEFFFLRTWHESAEGNRIALKRQKLKFRFHRFRLLQIIIDKHKEIHQLFSSFHSSTDGLRLCGSMLTEAGEMCAVTWLPVTCRFPCVLEYVCSLDTPARPAQPWPNCGAPFSLAVPHWAASVASYI